MQAARKSGFLVRGMVPWNPNKIGYMPYYRENYIFSISNPAFPISFLYPFFDFYIFSISLKIPPWAMVVSFLYHFPKSYIFPISAKPETISFLYHSGSLENYHGKTNFSQKTGAVSHPKQHHIYNSPLHNFPNVILTLFIRPAKAFNSLAFPVASNFICLTSTLNHCNYLTSICLITHQWDKFYLYICYTSFIIE